MTASTMTSARMASATMASSPMPDRHRMHGGRLSCSALCVIAIMMIYVVPTIHGDKEAVKLSSDIADGTDNIVLSENKFNNENKYNNIKYEKIGLPLRSKVIVEDVIFDSRNSNDRRIKKRDLLHLFRSSEPSSYSNKPTAGSSYSNKPTSGDSYSNKPTAGDSYSNKPTAGDSYSNKPTAGNSYSNKPTAGDSYSNKPTAGDSYSNKPTAGDSYSNKPTAGDSYSNKPTAGSSYSNKRLHFFSRSKRNAQILPYPYLSGPSDDYQSAVGRSRLRSNKAADIRNSYWQQWTYPVNSRETTTKQKQSVATELGAAFVENRNFFPVLEYDVMFGWPNVGEVGEGMGGWYGGRGYEMGGRGGGYGGGVVGSIGGGGFYGGVGYGGCGCNLCSTVSTIPSTYQPIHPTTPPPTSHPTTPPPTSHPTIPPPTSHPTLPSVTPVF